MLEKVHDAIIENKLIEPGNNVLVCISGGADSVCLLHILDFLSSSLHIKIYAVHINHMLRGKESDMDEEYVTRLCRDMDIKLFSISINVGELAKKDNISIEEAARNARYKEFGRLADQLGNCKIAVAHNKNDQAETIIMNIVRGTGLDGLKGIDYIRDNIIRPLLDVDREKIEEYCLQNNLEIRTDSTNLQNIYNRNKVRLEMIPFINKSFNANIIESIVRMSNLVKEDLDYMQTSAHDIYIKVQKESFTNRSNLERETESKMIYLDIDKLNKLHKAVLRRVIRLAILDVKGNLTNIESIHINKILELCLIGRTGAMLHLPSDIRVSRSYNNLKIYKYQKTENISKKIFNNAKNVNTHINLCGITKIQDWNIKLGGTIINNEDFSVEKFKNMRYNSLIQFFDYEKIKEGGKVIIRSRCKGDLIRPLKSNGTKKLKEYMIDNKIPRECRDKIPLLAKDNEIIWVIGYRISDKFKVTENTKSILKLEVTYEG